MAVRKNIVLDRSESQLPHPENGTIQRVEPLPMTAMDILNRAVESGRPVDDLRELMAMAERMQAAQAAREFARAISAFQSDCPTVRKNRQANITTKSGSQYGYRFADLEAIAETIRPLLTKHGLSYSWDSTEDGGKITCVCTVIHASGHTRTATFQCSIDSAAAMSGPQKSAAALTFAKRQALAQAFGITTGECDSDGAGDGGEPETITEKQAVDLELELENLRVDRGRFMEWARAAADNQQLDSLADIPARLWPRIRARMDSKREELKGGAKK